MTAPRLTIVDDHPLLAAALRSELERSGADVTQLDPADGADRLVEAIAAIGPDCAVLDLGLPFDGGGPALIGPLVDRDVRVVVLTGEVDRRLLARSSALGAEAVLSKSEPLDDIVGTVLQVANGQAVRSAQRAELEIELRQLTAEEHEREAPFEQLSPREQQVLAGLMDGRAPAVLAEENYVSVATVRSQIKSLLAKLGVSSQLEAVAMAHRSRWRGNGERS